MPAPPAQRCTGVVSSWVYAAILMCDNTLSVWFKRRIPHTGPRYGGPKGGVKVPGVVCNYPGTDARYYTMMLAWPSKGKFVRDFLYKKQGYRIIDSPCPPAGCGQVVPCCANAIPLTLHCTVSGSGSCDGSHALVWNSVTSRWETSDVIGSCPSKSDPSIAFQCVNISGNWLWGVFIDNTFITESPGSVTCSPFAVVFDFVSELHDDCGCASANATLTFTA